LEGKWVYNGTIHKLLIDFEKVSHQEIQLGFVEEAKA
jgi:hypothetical protein